MLNYCSYFLGNFWTNLCYFLSQHLVSLIAVHRIKLDLLGSIGL